MVLETITKSTPKKKGFRCQALKSYQAEMVALLCANPELFLSKLRYIRTPSIALKNHSKFSLYKESTSDRSYLYRKYVKSALVF